MNRSNEDYKTNIRGSNMGNIHSAGSIFISSLKGVLHMKKTKTSRNLTRERYDYIKELSGFGLSSSKISKISGLSAATIYRVLHTKDWAHYEYMKTLWARKTETATKQTEDDYYVDKARQDLPSDVVTELRRIASALELLVEEFKK